ncbi:TetR/AcrR family transcriptional regulator [Thalassotalea psychrophila]|uniref:TetR/AcrR family transcriptional regulator n=1 Tax=Thalassotalea psychrophila TaxID=3065647 RepID=A0ABY9TNW3_9GAMM|nr:TetR/AcrR family transcriptional regulator [Colwelliaceae bacterium SQ149]
MKTKDKILIASLDAFADEGVGQISTNHIADIMDISPGNLYYHFKSKSEIIAELLRCFTTDFGTFLKSDTVDISTNQSMWLKLNLGYQLMDKYRFIFCESSYILNKYPELRRLFTKAMQTTKNAIDTFCQHLQKQLIVKADEQEIISLSNNMHLLFTQWPSYIAASVRHGIVDNVKGSDEHLFIKQGVNQILNLIYPYLNSEDKQLLVDIQHKA